MERPSSIGWYLFWVALPLGVAFFYHPVDQFLHSFKVYYLWLVALLYVAVVVLGILSLREDRRGANWWLTILSGLFSLPYLTYAIYLSVLMIFGGAY